MQEAIVTVRVVFSRNNVLRRFSTRLNFSMERKFLLHFPFSCDRSRKSATDFRILKAAFHLRVFHTHVHAWKILNALRQQMCTKVYGN